MNSQGVIVGATQDLEWLLPWWWMNYCLYNSYPVTFVDFGDMSETARSWCQQRGNLIKIDASDDFITPKEKIDPELVGLWESMHKGVWIVRKVWFKKPLVMLKSPYQKTIWLDLDCQVRGSIAPIFELDLGEAGMTLAPEFPESQAHNFKRQVTLEGEIVYNSGVVVYTGDSPLMQEWAKQCMEQNHLFFGDQQLLMRIIFTQKPALTPMPILYNWLACSGINPQALILHWSGSFKNALVQQIMHLYKLCSIDLTLR